MARERTNPEYYSRESGEINLKTLNVLSVTSVNDAENKVENSESVENGASVILKTEM